MVKCSDCGYLAMRNRHTWNLDEAGRQYRDSGALPVIYDDQGRNQHEIHEQQPICFARVYDLKAEYVKETNDRNNTLSALNVIQKDRDCTEYTDWQQGFTPKEHREMLDREKMLKWQADREDADRKWKSRQEWNFVIMAGMFTILGAIIAAIFSLLR